MPQSRSHRLVVRQLADRLRSEAARVTSRAPLNADSKLTGQIDDAVGAVCRHVAEAFAAERDRDAARSVRFARTGVTDVQETLRAAVLKRLVGERDLKEAREVLSLLYPALSALLSEYVARSHRPMSRAPASPLHRPQ
jgi:four helix bundle protein